MTLPTMHKTRHVQASILGVDSRWLVTSRHARVPADVRSIAPWGVAPGARAVAKSAGPVGASGWSCRMWPVGLDLYAGPLTRYHAGTWLTVAQQAGQRLGVQVEILRAEPERDDRIVDPVVVAELVRSWQEGLGAALRCRVDWPEDGELPYWTDKPDWDGYGGGGGVGADEGTPEHAAAPRGGGPGGPRMYERAPVVPGAPPQPPTDPALVMGGGGGVAVAGGAGGVGARPP